MGNNLAGDCEEEDEEESPTIDIDAEADSSLHEPDKLKLCVLQNHQELWGK